ncbi:MAG: type II CAAX endopeptidase family protein [Planctomycetota bacterium]
MSDEIEFDSRSDAPLETPPITAKLMASIYGSMCLLSLFWLYFRGRLHELDRMNVAPLRALGLGFSFGLGVVALSWIMVYVSKSFRLFMGCFQIILGNISWQMVFWIAFWSSLAEELTFRGVLQPSWGIFWTSLAFGCCHFPANRLLIPWTLFAILAGVGLGYLQEYTQNLWAPISAHFTINFLNLYFLQSLKLSPEEQQQLQEKLRLISPQ